MSFEGVEFLGFGGHQLADGCEAVDDFLLFFGYIWYGNRNNIELCSI